MEATEVDGDWPVMRSPRRIGEDNAAEFHSERGSAGARLRPVRHYDRAVGGVVERLIGTLKELVHGLPGTVFSNVVQR